MFRNFVFAIALFASFGCQAAELSKETSSKFEQVEKERHLAMIDADISSVRAREISYIGRLTYLRQVCGETVISEATLARHQLEEEHDFNIAHALMTEQVALYGQALEATLSSIDAADHKSLCEMAKSYAQ